MVNNNNGLKIIANAISTYHVRQHLVSFALNGGRPITGLDGRAEIRVFFGAAGDPVLFGRFLIVANGACLASGGGTVGVIARVAGIAP
jgi:hypothetical protein